MSSSEFRDKYNRLISTGDVISYPLRDGSKMWMTDMLVLGFNGENIVCRDRTSVNAKRTKTKNVHNVIRIGTADELQARTTEQS